MVQRYAYINEGVMVEGPRKLPTSWRNISGLHLLPPEQLATLGWRPVVTESTDHHPRTQTRTGPRYIIEETQVREAYTITNLPLADVRCDLIAQVKAHAASLIRASGLPWMVERQVSGGAPIPQVTRDYCAAVRAATARIEAEINRRTLPGLATYDWSGEWPKMGGQDAPG